jgi:hypothetical protein
VALAQPVNRVGEVERANLDAQTRVPAAEARQQWGQDAAGRRSEGADGHRACLATRERTDAMQRLVDRCKDLAGVGEQRCPRRRQLDAPRAAHQQRPAELALKRADLRAQRGLGEAQPGCGAGEVQFLCHRDEVPELAEIHQRSIIAQSE